MTEHQRKQIVLHAENAACAACYGGSDFNPHPKGTAEWRLWDDTYYAHIEKLLGRKAR